MKRVLVVFGTRPEAIKMAPVVQALKSSPLLETRVCISSQHKELLIPVLELFEIEFDYDLDVMRPNQTLSTITVRILEAMERVFADFEPDMIAVHGDTTTAFAAALSAFYHKVSVAHVEAGLRTFDLMSPWPEELNRKLVGGIADLHFAPTESARGNLLLENAAEESIHVTGNTVVDALLYMRQKIHDQARLRARVEQTFSYLDDEKKLILVTGHRRESYGSGFQSICDALSDIATEFEEAAEIVYPVHLNPNVKGPVTERLSDISNLHLIEPTDYVEFIYLLERSHIILTDSGGIQEEAPAFGKPVLVMRNKTERREAIDAGSAQLVGTDRQKIFDAVSSLLTRPEIYEEMSQVSNPFGDGKAAVRIAKAISSHLGLT
ncbi:MAG: UDP-N-acetylglucosamine 2-epimerase (non-hydrolyzing) [Woeseiaceae bacterium]|nr:UDP-N-acetylglucosamine 2-epimerase (non-hydrolyzing) [Woeseiaceae bacterium]